jgi:hypothetical protein
MWANGCLNNGIIYAWHDDRKMIETAMGSEGLVNVGKWLFKQWNHLCLA